MPNTVMRLVHGDAASPAEPPPAGHDQATGREPEGDGPLTPERLSTLIRRLESGFYETREVREQIARRVRDELES